MCVWLMQQYGFIRYGTSMCACVWLRPSSGLRLERARAAVDKI